MKKTLFLLLILLSLKGFTQNMTHNEERSLGVIYSSNNWTSLAGFTQNGGTWTVSGGKIHCSTGAGTFTQSLDYTAYGASCLPTFHTYVRASVATVGGASYGVGAGKRSINPNGLYDEVTRVDMSSGGGKGYLNLGSGHIQANTTATALTINSGDLIEQTTDFDGYFITLTIRNVTTNSAPLVTTYIYSTNPAVDPLLPNTGNFSVFALGGNITIDSLAFSSSTPVNSALAIVGDSKVQGYAVTAQGFRMSDEVNQVLKSTIPLAGGYDRTTEVSERLHEIIALHPKVVLNLIGSNDVRTSVPTAVYEKTYDSINTVLTAAGIRVLVGVLYESSVNMLPLQQHIIATYPAANVIDLYDPLNISGTLYSDNVHLLNYGDSIAASVIIQTFGFFNQTSRYSPNLAAAYAWRGPHSFNVSPGLVAMDNQSFGSTSNNAQFGTFGIQSQALNNGYIQENLYFNGSNSVYRSSGFGTVMQMNAGNISFITASSGSAGANATLHTWLEVENSGIILTGSPTDHGFGNIQVNGTQGIAQYYDATHFANFSSDAAGDGLISSVSKFYGFGLAAATKEIEFGTNLSHADWGTSGIKLVSDPSTFTNTSTAGSGTVAHAAINVLNADSLTTTNTNITYTNASTLYIADAPNVVHNNTQTVVIKNPWALYINSGNMYVGGSGFNILNGGTGNVQQNSAGTFNWSSFVNTNAHWQFGYVTPPLSGGVYNHGTIDIDSLMNFNVPGNISIVNAGHGLNITEGSNSKVGQTSLTSGTKAITITGLTTSSRAFVSLVSQSGTVTTTINYIGVCTSNTLTISAVTVSGTNTINTGDASTINYFVIN